jgi:hypothetical protein
MVSHTQSSRSLRDAGRALTHDASSHAQFSSALDFGFKIRNVAYLRIGLQTLSDFDGG